MIIGVDEKQSGDGPICFHYFHKIEKCEARGESEREVDYAI
jgi:hypothetical protein